MHNQNAETRLSPTSGNDAENTKAEYGTIKQSDNPNANSTVVKQDSEISHGGSNMAYKTTYLECLLHLLNGMVGTNTLVMPVTFKNGGLWFSLFTVILLNIISTHCMHILVKCRDILSKRINDDDMDYAKVFEKAFATRTDGWNKYDNIARRLVNLFLVTTQIGFCCICMVFVAQNIKQVLDHVLHYSLNNKLYVFIVTLVLTPYLMVKSLKALVPFSTVANILNCLGLLIVIYNLLQDLPDVSTRPALPELSTLPVFFGQAVFSFMAIGVVIPLYDEMRNKDAFLRWSGVLNLGFTITVISSLAVGFCGYLKYGQSTAGTITLNLPPDLWIYLCAKSIFAVSVSISCAIQFYVPVNIVWPAIVNRCLEKSISLSKYSECTFRALLIFIIGGISALVPHFDLLCSLVGAFAGSFLLLIFPPIIELFTVKFSVVMVFKNTLIILIGTAGFVTGTFSSLTYIVDTF